MTGQLEAPLTKGEQVGWIKLQPAGMPEAKVPVQVTKTIQNILLGDSKSSANHGLGCGAFCLCKTCLVFNVPLNGVGLFFTWVEVNVAELWMVRRIR